MAFNDGTIFLHGQTNTVKKISHITGGGGASLYGNTTILNIVKAVNGEAAIALYGSTNVKKRKSYTKFSGSISLYGTTSTYKHAKIVNSGAISLRGLTKTEFIDKHIFRKKLFKVRKVNNILIKQSKIAGTVLDNNEPSSFIQDKIDRKSYNSRFLKDNSIQPVAYKKKVFKGDFVESSQFNDLFNGLSEDFGILDTAIKRLSSEIQISKNEIVSKTDDLRIDIKKTANILDTFALYSSIISGNIKGVKETFESGDSIIQSDSNSSLFVNLSEGFITLPQTNIDQIDLTKADIRIAPLSNGQFKNEFGINNSFDNNDTTYSHYYQEGGSDKLILQAEINVQSPAIMNNITILPNNFGYQNWLILEDLSVSSDGLTWHSIVSDYSLKSESSKEFSFVFIPKKVSFIRYRIAQNNKDFNGVYNIGISSFRANRIFYSNSGSIIVKKQIPQSQIGSIALHLIEAFYNEQMLQMNFQVSLDGKLWYDIQPAGYVGSKPEILYVNKPWIKNSIITSNKQIENIYIKIFFKSTLISDVLSNLIGNNDVKKSLFVEFPNKTPYQIKLTGQADPKSIQIGIVSKLALGKKTNNYFVLGETSTDKKKYIFDLPFDPKGLEEIVIGDIKIPKVNSLSDLYDLYQLGYYLDSDKLKLHINIDNQIPISTKDKIIDPWIVPVDNPAPKTNDIKTDDYQIIFPDLATEILNKKPIKMLLGYDTIDPESNIIRLTHLSDAIKENFYVARIDVDENRNIIQEQILDMIPAGHTVVKLTSVPVIGTETILVGGYMVEFIDGSREFEEAGEYAYSIDYNQGYVHLRNPYPVDTTIEYTRNREFKLNSNDYDVSNDGTQLIINPRIFDENSYYKISYNVLFLVDPSRYTVKSDNKTIELTDASIIDDYTGLDTLSNKLLKVSYLFKEDMSSFLKDIFTNITPILSDFNIVFSIEEV